MEIPIRGVFMIAIRQLGKEKAFREAVSELNHRLREPRLPFQYHDGICQFGNDEIVEKQVYEPFWSIVKDPKFKNVDIDIKEAAIDRRDSNGRDAALYALKALESAIEIISDDKEWTRGTERGAVSYVDNLVSSQKGRFIAVWEADLPRLSSAGCSARSASQPADSRAQRVPASKLACLPAWG
ncbi:MAG: hypothetical protein SWH78_10290 [Thermodesulfobacteriota bacterium]|nr:hypothetical protein [Thermodesulfobacteriota bacterium]